MGTRDRLARWTIPAVVASVLVVVAGVALLTGTRDRADEPTGAAHDTRTVTYRDVSLDVPRAWGWGREAGPDWCADVPGGERRFQDEPFVQLPPGVVVLAIACPEEEVVPAAFGSAPPRLWTPHVELADTDVEGGPRVPDGASTHRGWTLTARTVGDVQVRVLDDGSVTDLVQPILSSARVVERSPEGCEVASPAVAPDRPRPGPADITAVGAVSSITICQYRRGTYARPGLLAVRRLDGAPAQTLLEAIKQAPVGGGPDDPANCAEDDFGDRVLALHLESPDAGRSQVYVGYASCRGNGFDDGVAVRELTRDACLPLWGEGVELTGGSYEVFRRCHDDMPGG